MKTKVFLWIIIILGLICAFATGCNSFKNDKKGFGKETGVKEERAGGQAEQTSVKGRYQEEKIVFPLSIKNIFDG